ncbi:hypothetical protein [Hyphomonas sp.]|jgi:hypothetical protein|uniref:hypothetical protein n=1 Tax=Hyphomonas sp. TaxID=87 RepID=UPI0032EDB8C4
MAGLIARFAPALAGGGGSLGIIFFVLGFLAGGWGMDFWSDLRDGKDAMKENGQLIKLAETGHRVDAAMMKAHWQREYNLWELADGYAETTIEIAGAFERYVAVEGPAREASAARIRELKLRADKAVQDAAIAKQNLRTVLEGDAWAALPIPVAIRCASAGLAGTGGVLNDGVRCPGAAGLSPAGRGANDNLDDGILRRAAGSDGG